MFYHSGYGKAHQSIKKCLIADDMANSFEVVIECSGSNYGFHDACKLVKPLGVIVLKSTTSG